METFKKKLIELRKREGLSQEKLAADLNISQSSVSNYESGATTPDLFTLQEIADYFKVPAVCFLMDEKDEFHLHGKHGDACASVSKKLIELYEQRIKDAEEIRRLKEKIK